MNATAHYNAGNGKAGSGYVFWKNHSFWSQVVMNSIWDMGWNGLEF